MDLAGRGMATVSCDFLGERSPIPLGPARIAMRTGAALLVGTPAPSGDGRVAVTAERVDTGGDEGAVVERIAKALERRIMAWPAHWPWMHA
jgi:lauroyl/myristoyl acyltransferase